MPTRPPEIVETSRAAPFGLVLCDRSPHQTSDMRLMDWLTLSSGTNASRDTHGDGAAFNWSGSARSARNSSPPHYDTDPKPAVPSLNDEPGCIKVVDTFRFVTSMLGCVLGYGGYREEALARLQQAMRVSPHDPLTWLWQIWRASAQLYGRDFAAALDTLHEVVRLRPGYLAPHQMIAASLAHLGRLPEARAVLDRTRARFPEQDRRFVQQRPPWLRPEDNALRSEGLRLAAGETP